jgi:hypothetical protein
VPSKIEQVRFSGLTEIAADFQMLLLFGGLGNWSAQIKIPVAHKKI